MTLLQRGVISRLRKSPKPEISGLADRCRKAWSERRMLSPQYAPYLDDEIRADFLRANEQARAD